ncbi:MAG: hypothetical protein O7I42_08470 [Alphaproteobacteria bacterium]|nr:hypothetical protein [Alphaproteobacteria bacterium]
MPQRPRTKYGATRFAHLAAFVVLATLAAGGTGAKETGSFGLFVMYKVGDMPKYRRLLAELEENLGNRGCSVSIEGPIKGGQGDIQVQQPNRFIQIRCKRPLLRDSAGRSVVLKIRRAATNLIALEGPLTLHPIGKSASSRKSRSYIFKVSHYNNLEPNHRDSEPPAINRLAASRPDSWREVGAIAVTDAIGMRRPDEVVILFYDGPEQAKRFRKNNPDILKRIGAFNKRHLINFIYYIASSDR